MFKVSYFPGETERGQHVYPLFSRGDAAFEKTAAPNLLPDVQKYINSLRPTANAQYVLVNAMGASEWWGCFPAGTLIRTPDGEVPIEEIEIGEEVLTHRNRFRHVLGKKPKQYCGTLVDLYVQGLPSLGPSLTATPNHELWVVLRDNFIKTRRDIVYQGDTSTPVGTRRAKMLQSLTFDWIPIGTLQRGDIVAQPFPLEEDASGLGDTWEDPDLAFLLGLYAAEGCVSTNYKKRRCGLPQYDKIRKGQLERPLSNVVFVIGAHESWKVARVRSIVEKYHHSLRDTLIEETHSIRLEVSWQGLAETCADHIGRGAENKQLSSALLRMPREWQKTFFFAYAEGDGCTRKEGRGEGSYRCVSASPALLVGMRLLLARLGVVSSISGRHNKKATWYNGTPIYELLVGGTQFSEEGSQAKSYIHPDGFLLSAVSHVDEYSWDGDVYDLQVEEDCSYTASGISVHNSNVNGDAFNEESLIYKPKGWAGNPIVDRSLAKEWPYGFPTFYNAHPYQHHKNKNPERAYGEIELTSWHPHMKRVELVIRVDKDKCDKFGGSHIWDKLHSGHYVDVSMGSKVPFDTCSICLDWPLYRHGQSLFDPKKHKHPGESILELHKQLKADRGHGIRGLSITRADYCDHARRFMNKILPDGRKVFVYNDYPRFFDISFVFIGADKTAKVMLKIAGPGHRSFWDIGSSALLAEKLGYADDSLVKTAGEEHELQGHTEFQGLSIDIENRKGSVRSGVDKDGNKWRTVMKHPYGYIKGTKGADGEEVDAYVGPNKEAPIAYVVHQHKDNGKGFDEDKVMLGFNSKEQAQKAFLAHYDDPKFLGPISEVPVERLQELVEDGKPLKKISAAAAEEILKRAFLGKDAKDKKGEIVKEVPSSIPAGTAERVARDEPILPRSLLDALGRRPLEQGLATAAGLGMVLRPAEFQRMTLIHIGRKDLADDFDNRGVTFPRVDEETPFHMGPEHFHPGLARALLPFFGGRSALGPSIEKRTIVIVLPSSPKKKEASSLPSLLLHKIGAAYNGYRTSLMELFANAQDLIKSATTESELGLRKVASMPVEEVFTPLTAEYLKLAFWDECGVCGTSIGATKVAQANANVEGRSSPRNTENQRYD